MIAENNDGKNWRGNGDVTADKKANGGVATETRGREIDPDLYLNDGLGRAIKKKKDSIWTRGKEVRVKHKEEE